MNQRRALALGALLVVVVVAAVVAVVALRDDGSEAASYGEPQPADAYATPDVPETAPEPAFPPAPRRTATPPVAPVPEPTPTSDATWEELTEQAEDEGTVPVIVTLRTPVRPEGTLPAPRRGGQQERIENAAERLLQDLQGTGAEDVEQFEPVPLVTLEATPEALEELRNSAEVVTVVEDVPLPLPLPVAGSAADGLGARQWTEADAFWHVARTDAKTAWDNGYDGRGQTIAVLDTGIDSNHPWLAGKVVEEACFSAANNCPGNVAQATGPGSGQPCTYADSCGHGTHVAHDAVGKYGVAPRANVVAVQVFSRIEGQCSEQEGPVCARTYVSDQLKGLQRVYELRDKYDIAAVNLSLGGGKFPDYCDTINTTYSGLIKTLVSYGIGVVIATGNEGLVDGIGEPACYQDALATGATTLDATGSEAVWTWSNRAPRIFNALAPGDFICSAWPGGLVVCGSGTSFASPLVAGAFATLRQLNPQASVAAMREAIVCSGVPISDGSVQRVRLSVWRAVNALKDGC
jgi:subtilisin